MRGLGALLFPEFINIVPTLFYNFIEFLVLLVISFSNSLLVISFALNKE